MQDGPAPVENLLASVLQPMGTRTFYLRRICRDVSDMMMPRSAVMPAVPLQTVG